MTTFNLRRPKRRRYVNTFFLTLVFCRIFPQVLMQICLSRVLPQTVSHHIISIILSFWQENTQFLVADSAQRMKIQIPLFWKRVLIFSINGESSMNQGPWFWKYVSLYSSRNLRRARCQTVVGYNEDNQPYHHTECIFSVSRYNANIL